MHATMYKHKSAPSPPPLMLLLILLLLLPGIAPQWQPPVHQCLGNNVLLECKAGQVLLVQSAFLGVSARHNPATGNCPRTSNKCRQYTPRVSELCNRRQTCSFVHPDDTLIVLTGCAPPNYIDVTYTCVQVSTTINICGWTGVVRAAASYIVNDDYPLVIPARPHRCQCTIERLPDSTAPTTAVALIVKDAYFTGRSCQQRLYAEFPGHSTQNSTVCSDSHRVSGRTILSTSSIQNGESIYVIFDKTIQGGDAGTFVVYVEATSPVAMKCAPSALPASTSTERVPTSWTGSGLMTSISTAPSESTTGIPQGSITNNPTVASESTSGIPQSSITDDPTVPSKSTTGIPQSSITNNPTVPSESTTSIPQSSPEQHSMTTPVSTVPFASPKTAGSNEKKTEQTYIIAGATVGGVALILIILAVVLIVWRKRRRRRPQSEADQLVSSRTSNEQGANNTEAQLADGLQVYATFPNEVISNQDTLKETPFHNDNEAPMADSLQVYATFPNQVISNQDTPTETPLHNDNEAQMADSLQVYATFPNQVISNQDTPTETPVPNDNEAQMADSLQVYATFPNQVISNQDTLRETPFQDDNEEQKPKEKRPRMPSDMGETIFIDEPADPSDSEK